MSAIKNKPKYQNKEWLNDQYINLGKKIKEIAREQEVSTSTINSWLNKHSLFKYGNGYFRPLKKNKKFLKKNRGYYISYKGKQKKYSRVVMEEFLGRELSSNEIVHHINFDKLDDRIENLIIVTKAEHLNIHLNIDLMKLLLEKQIIYFDIKDKRYNLND